jgi:hypothetical protein
LATENCREINGQISKTAQLTPNARPGQFSSMLHRI